MTAEPGDNAARRFPVSVKGVLFVDGRIVLLRNERDEWELPGGKLEEDEEPDVCVVREIEEELSLAARTPRLLDTWLYTIVPGVTVLIVTFGMAPLHGVLPVVSHEHKEVRLFDLAEIDGLSMPDGYRRSIRTWAELLRAEG
jgi:8-oxo-dGTP pyrophosphatase MutT (NUDIX family)